MGGNPTISGNTSIDQFKVVFCRCFSFPRISPSFVCRAIAEELAEERGGFPEGSNKSDHDLKTLKKKADLGRPDFAGKGDKSFWWEIFFKDVRFSLSVNLQVGHGTDDRETLCTTSWEGERNF